MRCVHKIFIIVWLLGSGWIQGVAQNFPGSIVGPDTVCQYDTMAFQASPSGSDYVYWWQLISGNPIILTTNNAVSYKMTFPQATPVIIRLILEHKPTGQKDTIFKDIFVYPNQIPEIQGKPVTCLDSVATFTTNVSNASYYWQLIPSNFGTFISSDTQQTVQIKHTLRGFGYVKLTVTNSLGCQSEDVVKILADSLPEDFKHPHWVCPNTSIAHIPAFPCDKVYNYPMWCDTCICYQIHPNAYPHGLYNPGDTVFNWNYTDWQLTGNAYLLGNSSPYPYWADVTAGSSGDYTLGVTISGNGCSTRIERTFPIVPPQLQVTASKPRNVCLGDTVYLYAASNYPEEEISIHWNIQQYNIYAAHSYYNPDTFAFIVRDNSPVVVTAYLFAGGCKEVFSQTFYPVPSSEPEIQAPDIMCEREVISLKATTLPGYNSTFLWEIVGGNASLLGSPNDNPVTLTNVTSDSVLIRLTAKHTCTDVIYKTIYVADSAYLNIFADTVCYGEPQKIIGKINPSLGGNYTWFFDNSLTQSINPSSEISFPTDSILFFRQSTRQGENLYLLWSKQGCPSDTAIIPLEIYSRPYINNVSTTPTLDSPLILPDREIFLFADFSVLKQGGIPLNFIWQAGSLSDTSLVPDYRFIFPKKYGKYPFYLILQNQAHPECADTFYVGEIIVKYKDVVYIPNAFSPNGDGKNETWRPIANGASELTTTLYDRWGNVIKILRGQESWDGTDKNGNPLPEGVYIYKMQAKFFGDTSTERAGSVFLIR